MAASLLLSSFDRTERIRTQVARPEVYRELHKLIASQERVIARGAGLSYSAASFGEESLSIDLTKFDRMLAFDAESGFITIEPGVRIGALAAFLATRKRQLPALPGYPTISVGGCIAFDVHGKSQFHSGNFGAWVHELTVVHRDYGELVCSREQNRELFELTVGGMGLTGVITRASLRTAPLLGSAIETTCVAANNLREAAEIMQARASEADTLYSWNNLNLRGPRFGSGLVYVERFVDTPCAVKDTHPRIAVHSRLPVTLWNRATTNVILSAYKAASASGPRVADLQTATFPIYGKEVYYAGFGARGFREYQLIVPWPRWGAFVDALEPLLARSGVPVTLGSLKLFRGERRFVRFSGEGVCLALDVPATARSRQLFAELDQLAIAHEAVVNLSKDSRIEGSTCARVFAEFETYRTDLARYDQKRRCQSKLREQLGV